MGTVNSRKSYEAWTSTLTSQENAELAKVEKIVSRQLGITAPKGLREWREFVTACVDMYMVRQGAQVEQAAPKPLKGAHRRHAEYLASIVITSNCGTCGPRDKAACGWCYPADSEGNALVVEKRAIVMVGRDGASQPIYRYRDELSLPDWQQSQISAADRARIAAPVTVAQAVTGALLAGAQSWIDETAETLVPETPAEVRSEWDAEIAQAEILAADLAVMDEVTRAPSAMDVILSTVSADSGHIHGGVTSGELVAAGANRGAITRAVKAGWVTMLAVNPGQAESDRAPRYYLSKAGQVERDRRLYPTEFAPAPGAFTVGDQPQAARVTTVKLGARRKPSLHGKRARGWK